MPAVAVWSLLSTAALLCGRSDQSCFQTCAAPFAGVENVDIDLPSKKVTVRGNVTPEAVKDKVGTVAEYCQRPAAWQPSRRICWSAV